MEHLRPFCSHEHARELVSARPPPCSPAVRQRTGRPPPPLRLCSGAALQSEAQGPGLEHRGSSYSITQAGAGSCQFKWAARTPLWTAPAGLSVY